MIALPRKRAQKMSQNGLKVDQTDSNLKKCLFTFCDPARQAPLSAKQT